MKRFLGILVLGLLWCNVGIAETSKEHASSVLSNKFKHALEGVISGLIFTAIAFIFAKIIKALFKKDIAYKNFYGHAFVAGFLLRGVILILLK